MPTKEIPNLISKRFVIENGKITQKESLVIPIEKLTDTYMFLHSDNIFKPYSEPMYLNILLDGFPSDLLADSSFIGERKRIPLCNLNDFYFSDFCEEDGYEVYQVYLEFEDGSKEYYVDILDLYKEVLSREKMALNDLQSQVVDLSQAVDNFSL